MQQPQQQQYTLHVDEILGGERWMQWIAARAPGYRVPQLPLQQQIRFVVRPEVGFSEEDIVSMASVMNIPIHRLVRTLSRSPNCGNMVREMLGLLLLNVVVPRQMPHTPRLLPLITTPNGDDDETTCTICLETSINTPHMEWVTAEGCALHRFHSNCIRGWNRGTCPVCRARLL